MTREEMEEVIKKIAEALLDSTEVASVTTTEGETNEIYLELSSGSIREFALTIEQM
jgi:hypothetical protein